MITTQLRMKFKSICNRLVPAVGGAALFVGSLQMAQAQVTPLWTNSHSETFLFGTYYDNIDFTSPQVTRYEPSINFDWGFNSPYSGFIILDPLRQSEDLQAQGIIIIPHVNPDTFSVRWVGEIEPRFTENYTFYALTDDGFRLWVNDELLIDSWIDQAPTEHASVPFAMTAGTRYRIKVDYFENTGGAVAKLFWSSPSQFKEIVPTQGSVDGRGDGFGTTLAPLGNGRFAVGAPSYDFVGGFFGNGLNVGQAWYGSTTGIEADNQYPKIIDRSFGASIAGFEDGSHLIGSPGARMDFFGNATRSTLYLFDPEGEHLGTWPDPTIQASLNNSFGHTLITLQTDRFAASSLEGGGRVFIFDTNHTVTSPLTTITNPSTSSSVISGNPNPVWSGSFGSALSPLGTDRLLIGSPNESVAGDQAGSVFIYNLAGNQIRKIRNPMGKPDLFGGALAEVDQNRFLVGAPHAEATYLSGSQLLTNSSAGSVYLYDANGTRLLTIISPDLSRSGQFGAAITLLGTDRVLIGSPTARVGNISEAGAVYIFNLEGIHLETINNPTPSFGDRFGASVVALDDRRLVIGAPGDDTLRTDAGSIYAFDAPPATMELGAEIPRPSQGLDISGSFPSQGPTVTPSGAAFWHVQSQKLFAVKPGEVLVTWPLDNSQTDNWQATVGWPTNINKFQVHVAGPTPVDLGVGGLFSEAMLHATTTDADPNAVSQSNEFSANTPGNTLLMLSSGDPSTNPIRFQLIRTIAWNDAAHLHDDAPATVGLPIVDPAGYHDPSCGAPQVVVTKGIYAPAPVFDPATRTGTIIPVNRDSASTESDDLVVAFYQKGTKLFDPVTGANVVNEICWPHKPVRFRPAWPGNAPKIIIASQQGTGAIDPALFIDWELYLQNNPAEAGFNPNDEHALRRPFGAGEAVFALRDDLATSSTSEPFVLIRYRDPSNGLQWRMKVWKVVAEEAPHFFRYPAEAGLLIQPPMPLSALAPSPQTQGVSGPFWRDRKLFFWARAAGDDGGTAEIVMRYFYPMQPGFFFPGGNPPAVGANVPLLDLRAGTPGIPINIRYDASWPEDAPELRVGETLVMPKNGLPQIAGQSSVEILYQQSFPQEDRSSVQLIDPVRIRAVPLAQLPTDVETRVQAGNLHFPTLPPHLEGRVTYDPIADQLRLSGDFVEPPAGEAYLLLNVLTPRDKAALLALSTDTNFRNAVENLAVAAESILEVHPDSEGFDSLALTAGNAQGTGYVTLAFGNSTTLSEPAEPISVSVIKVTCPLYRGELKVIQSPNPLAEQLTLRHSGDFAGEPDNFEFEWRTLPPIDGLPSAAPPEQWSPFVATPPTGIGAVDITISGPGLYTLSDNYFVCRYRRISGISPCGSDWSAWTPPMLAEGWIKRVLAGIGPFEQRIKDYQDTAVNTIVSMISQAGPRAVGDIALNLDAVNEAGLVEVYETVLRRGLGLSIEGAPPVDYPPANDALLLAAGRLADLYMLLGNEAYADAADPTIAFGTDHGVYGSQATSLHCFMNQTASLLEEELALLRGRDSSKLPNIETHPIYNRLIWNFTRDITGGEVAYALNYNIRNQNGDVAGAIDEADAALLYPQGHGDAWGHYLTAIKNYYRLLRNPNFTWVPRIEAVIVGGVPTSVDYLDERKFAAAAAARVRTGAEVVNLTFRDRYVEDPAKPWQTQNDTDSNRAWGLSEWASRAGQGALLDWVVANAMLPEVDSNPNHTGIQKIERANISELPEIAEGFRQIQEQADQADSGRNPLGLANNVVPFDIDPGGIASGKTHFDQINERANESLKNAVAVFDHANASTQLLRRQADDSNNFQQRTVDGESDFNNRLIEIFGTPYADDIGPTGTYPTGYTGPDIYHFDYVDSPELETHIAPPQTIQLQLMDLSVTTRGAVNKTVRPVTFHISANGLGLAKPPNWTGERRAPGEIQQSRLSALEALRRLERAVADYENLLVQITDTEESFQAELLLREDELIIRSGLLEETKVLNEFNAQRRLGAHNTRQLLYKARNLYEFASGVLPTMIGMANDSFAPARAKIRFAGRIAAGFLEEQAQLQEIAIQDTQEEKGEIAALAELQILQLQGDFSMQQRLAQLEQLVRQERTALLELGALSAGVEEAVGRHQAAIARGLRLLEERTRFRQQTAAQIQGHRYKDMAFRLFRSDALQKYRAQFDLAARYSYLAAKAYDYETCLAPGDNRGPGSEFLTSIIRSRSLGRFSNGTPLPGAGTGDPGLADPLARMTSNWNLVLRSQLGFNNPQTETGRFSLRNEMFRVLTGAGGSQRWRETLDRHVVPNILAMPEFQRHCIPFSPRQPVEPAIVIPFSTTINFGLNFFGWPAGGGDNDYDSTKFATRVRSVGVWFANYNNLGGGMINTPRVYLVPVGLDLMRAPTQGDPYIREWRILDQALPVPFPLNGGAFSNPSWIPINDSLSEDFAAIRRFGQFRAYHDSGNFNPAETITDSRLIGRSVWNTRWLLIIPAGTLHTDRNEGIQRFINGALRLDGTRDGNGVTDIKIFFQTYAYSGN